MPRALERKKRRMPCQLKVNGSRHTGLVLDLSPSGLFIQTSAKTQPGERFEIEFSVSGEDEPVVLQVEVVRKVVVPPRLLAVAHGGIGVRVTSAPEAYYRFMQELGVGGGPATQSAAPAPDPGPAEPRRTLQAGETPTGAGSRRRTAKKRVAAAKPRPAKPATAPAPPPPPEPVATLLRFRVRVKQIGGSRSRIIDVEAEDAGTAEASAMDQVGDGWKVLAAEAR